MRKKKKRFLLCFESFLSSRLNRASLHELERDSQDKFRARVLDAAAHNIKTTSRGINFYEGIEMVDNT